MKPETRTVKIPRKLTREFEVDLGERQGDEGAELYPITLTSTFPVKRWSWDGPYYEVLSHKPDDVDLARAVPGLPLLKNHMTGDQIGSVQGVRLDMEAEKTRGLLSFSSIRMAQDQKALVDEGHLKTSSVGYFVTGMRLIKTDENDVPTYEVSWAIAEESLTPVPADPTVGVGRSAEDSILAVRRVAADELVEFKVADHIRADEPADEGGEREMKDKDGREIVAVTPTPTPALAGIARDYGKEAAEIAGLCAAHGRADKAEEFIREQVEPGVVARMILDEIRTDGPAQPGSEALDIKERDVSQYSIRRAMGIVAGMENRDGMEAEIHDELIVKGAKPTHGGMLVPWRLRGNDELSPATHRVLGTTEPTGGATLVGTQTMPDMIDLLRNKTRVLELGAKLYQGLEGVVQFNKKTGEPTVSWMAENPPTPAAGSTPSYGFVTMAGKTMIGTVTVPRQLLTMASFDVEADIRSDLALGHATLFDLAAIHGTGTDKQPIGIYSAGDVQAQPFTGIPDLPELTACVGKIADVNADFGALAWLTTPLMAALMSRTPLIGDTYPKFIWDGKVSDGEMIGYKALASSQVSKTLESAAKHGIIFGNWNEIALGVWGNDLELIVDPLTRATSAQVVITSFSMGDTALLRPQSFVKGTGATIV